MKTIHGLFRGSAHGIIDSCTVSWSVLQAARTRHIIRSWPTGSMVLWVAVLLGASLVLSYI